MIHDRNIRNQDPKPFTAQRWGRGQCSILVSTWMSSIGGEDGVQIPPHPFLLSGRSTRSGQYWATYDTINWKHPQYVMHSRNVEPVGVRFREDPSTEESADFPTCCPMGKPTMAICNGGDGGYRQLGGERSVEIGIQRKCDK